MPVAPARPPSWRARLLDAVAPARCCGCLTAGTWLCTPCATSLRPLPLKCIVCREASPQGLVCPGCRSQVPLTGVVSAGSYVNPLFQRGIHWLKFKSVRSVAPTLAQCLIAPLLHIAPLPQLAAEAALIPIPLHARRERERGFNQSAELATHLGAYTGIPVISALTRQRQTHTQSHLPAELRAKNLNDAFAVTALPPPDRKTLILIDDVATSGATLAAAARVLHRQGKFFIWATTVAVG